jgi:hypothetical protein
VACTPMWLFTFTLQLLKIIWFCGHTDHMPRAFCALWLVATNILTGEHSTVPSPQKVLLLSGGEMTAFQASTIHFCTGLVVRA